MKIMMKVLQSNDVDRIRALREVLEQGSFSKASESLGLTQAAVSTRVKELEYQYGQQVLVRTKPLRLTSFGQKLVYFLVELEHSYQQIVGVEPERFKLRMALNQDSLDMWAENLLSLKEGGQCDLEFKVTGQDKTFNLLQNGEVDFSISDHYVESESVASELLGEVEYGMCVSMATFERSFKGRNYAKVLSDFPYVLYDRGDKLHETYLRSELGIEHFSSTSVDYLPSNALFRSTLFKGRCCALVPISLVANSLRNKKLKELYPKKRLRMKLYINYFRYSPPRLMKMIKAAAVVAKRSV